VLGPVEILNAARQFTRAWAVELIVYLSVHPGGVSNEQWATALWPDKAMAPASLHSTASAARRSLGTADSGDDHLPRSRGRLALGPDVRTDWDRFVDLSTSALPDDWREALSLIRGRPFDGLRSPDWVVLEGILATVDAVVVDLACRYAEHCLEDLDAPGAEWSARQGLRVSPYDERLYRVLLKASDVAGNPAGVESTMAELVHLVADDVEPFDAVHPETLALYRRLSRRSSIARTH
jgi:DNA-binding SARP family transcriptional activator